jgi:hypothetical protein
MSDEYDPDNHGYGFEDICERLDNIEAAIEANHANRTDASGWVLVVVILFALSYWIPEIWYSKIRYSWSYGVSTDQVTIEKKPTDCDFLRAPLGSKDCHYDRQVSAIEVKTDNSDPAKYPVNYVSFDDGKTWVVDDAVPPTRPQVLVSWNKIEDQ